MPVDFRARIWENGENVEDSIHRSKAVGEPPLMLAMSVFYAIKDAIAAAEEGVSVPLNAPATPPEILRAIDAVRGAAA
jgi:xanthine dehydrogenase large subunit